MNPEEQDIIQLKRDVHARMVPSGTKVVINEGLYVRIEQELGKSFTVYVNGNLARIEGYDADALGREAPKSEYETPDDGEINIDQVWEALGDVYDPEIPVSIVQLGLVYDCKINKDEKDQSVWILMTLTSPGCGMGPVLEDDVYQSVLNVPNVNEVDIEFTFSPPWSMEHLTDEAKLELGLM